ncbi:hypothetical protein AB0I75_01935 [Streptomyces sp. NPDC050273]|uniref:hypothetical protein n=1 Tax=Streptomyces sp. NPDC050273 TaxID=3154933 RepID=UPI00343D2AA7
MSATADTSRQNAERVRALFVGADPGEEALRRLAPTLWAARSLSAVQAEHVAEPARSLRGDSGGEYRVNLLAW